MAAPYNSYWLKGTRLTMFKSLFATPPECARDRVGDSFDGEDDFCGDELLLCCCVSTSSLTSFEFCSFDGLVLEFCL